MTETARATLVLSGFVAIVFGSAVAVQAKETTGGIVRDLNGLTGLLKSAWVLPAEGSTSDLLSVPAGKTFALTQACMIYTVNGSPSAKVELTATSGGRLVILTADRTCVDFTPGIAIEAGNTLQCSNSSNIGSINGCTVTGVLSDL